MKNKWLEQNKKVARAHVGGGYTCFIGGGHCNTVSGSYSVICGGTNNTISGTCTSANGDVWIVEDGKKRKPELKNPWLDKNAVNSNRNYFFDIKSWIKVNSNRNYFLDVKS